MDVDGQALFWNWSILRNSIHQAKFGYFVLFFEEHFGASK